MTGYQPSRNATVVKQCGLSNQKCSVMNPLIRLFQKISYWYEVRKIERYNKKLLKDLESVFEEYGITKRKAECKEPEGDHGTVYHISFHNYRSNSSDNQSGKKS